MKHSIVYKGENQYSSFPLLKKLNDRILIGFFVAPFPDHMGLFEWKVLESFDQGETWRDPKAKQIKDNFDLYDSWYWPSISSRETSDTFRNRIGSFLSITGSYGFKAIWKKNKGEISKSVGLFHRTISNNWEIVNSRTYGIPDINLIVTFPRFLHEDNLILVPAYAILHGYGNLSRCFVWRSEDNGKSFHLWNMFPDGINGNEMAFIKTKKGILAHIRSDKQPYLMESWSFDNGLTWTYPTLVFIKKYNQPVTGGPPHLLRLKDGRILCSYGYRYDKMGIRAIVSEDEGDTWSIWSIPIILRDDSGYLSSLHKRTWKNKFKLPSPANDVGYPVSIQLDDESILTAYYITCKDRITGIETTKWSI